METWRVASVEVQSSTMFHFVAVILISVACAATASNAIPKEIRKKLDRD